MVSLLGPLVGAASGQPSWESMVTVGSRVRLETAAVAGQRVQGTVADIGAEALTVTTDSQQRVVVTRSTIRRLELSTGQHRQTVHGILIGAATGAVLSVVLPKCVNEGCTSSGGFDPTFALLYAFGGAACGGLIGTAIKTEGWSSVPLQSVRVGIAPTPHRGIRVAVSLDLARLTRRRTKGS